MMIMKSREDQLGFVMKMMRTTSLIQMMMANVKMKKFFPMNNLFNNLKTKKIQAPILI
jgi:hypothetical protein